LEARRTVLAVSNNSAMKKGFGSTASSCSHGHSFSFSVGAVPDARMTGSVMSSERNFLIRSRPVTLGMVLSVIRMS
jgi:hypothetical protein